MKISLEATKDDGSVLRTEMDFATDPDKATFADRLDVAKGLIWDLLHPEEREARLTEARRVLTRLTAVPAQMQ